MEPDDDADLEPDPQEGDNRALLLALFLLLARDTEKHLITSVTLYLRGQTSIQSLQRTLTDALLGAHLHATYLGRRLAGVSEPLSEADQTFARAVMQGQAAY